MYRFLRIGRGGIGREKTDAAYPELTFLRPPSSSPSRCLRLVLLFSFISIGSATFARAQTPDLMKLPGNLNLGYTSFLDGFGLQKPGCAYLQYVRNNYWNEIHDKSGHDIPVFDNPKIDETVGVSQLTLRYPF